jgi:phenylacetate-coenzyme A ligase PaaK-like adenylate-forming protein
MKSRFREAVFGIMDDSDFMSAVIEILTYQYENNPVYRSFADSLGRSPWKLKNLNDITFLPVEFFRNHPVITGRVQVEMIFQSSGTTGSTPGRHFIKDISFYEESFLRTFRLFYGNPENYIIAAILPSYTERCGSSLVYMADRLIKETNHPLSGFYKDDIDRFLDKIKGKKFKNRRVLIIGVSFALLDLAEKYDIDLSNIILMETGGMKGRRKEVVREELHTVLKNRLSVGTIHSEYGMTELLSQAYSTGNGLFRCPPWMKILIRDPQDPLTILKEPGRTGGINIIDLANVNSCAFIATSDLGKLHEDGSFEVLGRFDNSDVRGCNLMVE